MIMGKNRRSSWQQALYAHIPSSLVLLLSTTMVFGPAMAMPKMASGPAMAMAIPQAVKSSCMVCHGMTGGDTIYPNVPRLAGQQIKYLTRQLQQYKDTNRADQMGQIYMWPVARSLDARQIAEVAKYFASQPPMRSSHAVYPGVTQGKAIFLQGIPAAGIPACMACHGVDAQGKGAFPRLAGQRYQYIVDMTMGPGTQKLTPAQIHEIAAYLSSL
ncbi:MAG: c-type cytochrome [Acidithiobacillus sp.]